MNEEEIFLAKQEIVLAKWVGVVMLAYPDVVAKRVLNCTRARCRRRRTCTAISDCAMRAVYPASEQQADAGRFILRRYLEMLWLTRGDAHERMAYLKKFWGGHVKAQQEAMRRLRTEKKG